MPKEFLEIYKIIRNMKYIEKPNYERIINILKEGKIKILKEYFQNNKFFEKYNGKIIQFNFIWEKILFDYALYDKAPKNKNSNDMLLKIINKYHLNIQNYVKALFDL